MNINDQMALLGYAQMLDDTVSVPGMKGGEPVRILMNEIQRLTAARDAAGVPVEIPEYGECAMLDQNGEDLNPLQEFVYCQEPAANPPGVICGVDPKEQFREQLKAVLEWVVSRPAPAQDVDVVMVPMSLIEKLRAECDDTFPVCGDDVFEPGNEVRDIVDQIAALYVAPPAKEGGST